MIVTSIFDYPEKPVLNGVIGLTHHYLHLHNRRKELQIIKTVIINECANQNSLSDTA